MKVHILTRRREGSTPTYVSSEIGDVRDDKVVVTFSHVLLRPADKTGHIVEYDGTPKTVQSASYSGGDKKIILLVAESALGGTVVTYQYDGSGTTRAAGGKKLLVVSETTVTNNI